MSPPLARPVSIGPGNGGNKRFPSAVRQRQEEKRQQEESSKVKERKRKREKYAEKVGLLWVAFPVHICVLKSNEDTRDGRDPVSEDWDHPEGLEKSLDGILRDQSRAGFHRNLAPGCGAAGPAGPRCSCSCETRILFSPFVQQKRNEESESKRKREANLVISHTPSADNSNLSADGDDSFLSVEMDSAMPSPFSEVRRRRRGSHEYSDPFHPLIPCIALLLLNVSPPAALLPPSPRSFPSGSPSLTPRRVCVCLCVLLCLLRSPSAASCSPARCPRTPTPTRAAATCWSSWTTRCRRRRSRAPPTRPPRCRDQPPTT